MKNTIQFNLNNKPVNLEAENDQSLLWVLRAMPGLTGTKYGCGSGSCGSCTVLVDKEPVNACMTYMEDVQGKNVTTIEGLALNGELHPVQKAFVENDALQCGFCTPGMILKATGLLIKNPNLKREEIIKEMDTNLCRCGSYGRILDAIQSAAKNMKGGQKI